MRVLVVKLAILLSVLAAGTAYSAGLQFYEGDTFSKSDDPKVAITYSGVDDIIAAFVLNKITVKRLEKGGDWKPSKMAQWSSNPGPSGTWDISDDLRGGDNIVLVAVHNLVYTGFCLGKCGKASWSYTFTCGSTTIDSSSRRTSVNVNRLMHLFAVKIIKDSRKDRFTVTRLSDEEEDLVVELETYVDSFLGQQGMIDVDWGEVIGSLGGGKQGTTDGGGRTPASSLFQEIAKSLTPSAGSPWEHVCATPEGVVPQGMTLSRGQILLSAHRNDHSSVLFRLDEEFSAFHELFDFPPEATHTSGIDLHPDHPNLLFAVDYNSDRIYAIDFQVSVKQKKAVVLAAVESGLEGTSACCFVPLPKVGPCLLVSDFRNSCHNVFFRYDEQRRSIVPVEKYRYRNPGFSQGLTWHNGAVFETGNLLLSSYVVMHDLTKALELGRVVPIRSWTGPAQLIEDVVLLDGYLYVASEGSHALYKIPIDDSVFAPKSQDGS